MWEKEEEGRGTVDTEVRLVFIDDIAIYVERAGMESWEVGIIDAPSPPLRLLSLYFLSFIFFILFFNFMVLFERGEE